MIDRWELRTGRNPNGIQPYLAVGKRKGNLIEWLGQCNSDRFIVQNGGISPCNQGVQQAFGISGSIAIKSNFSDGRIVDGNNGILIQPNGIVEIANICGGISFAVCEGNAVLRPNLLRIGK